jgi:H/ACA ribonucleoprotein complex subunit 4
MHHFLNYAGLKNLMKIDIEKIRREKPIKELINFSIINMDKPSGPTSFQTDLFVKQALGLSKTSHFGTLDPMVTGVLPIALSRACKLAEYFMHKDKVYVGIMKIHKEISIEELQKRINEEFTGKIMQLPPRKSRVKRQEREREIKKFEIIEKNGNDIIFIAEVQAGTYIRKLVSDLGDKIGGAHMTELRRTKASIFSEEDENFVDLYKFKEAVEEYNAGNEEKLREILIPAEIISTILPVVQAKEASLKILLTGKPLFRIDLESEPDEEIFAVFYKDKFIEVAKKSSEGDIIARPQFVFN